MGNTRVGGISGAIHPPDVRDARPAAPASDSRCQRKELSMNSISPGVFVERALAWVRSAYPDGVPSADRPGLMCVLGERLTADELDSMMTVMPEMADGMTEMDVAMVATVPESAADNVTSLDLHRVAGRLASAGWPLAEVA